MPGAPGTCQLNPGTLGGPCNIGPMGPFCGTGLTCDPATANANGDSTCIVTPGSIGGSCNPTTNPPVLCIGSDLICDVPANAPLGANGICIPAPGFLGGSCNLTVNPPMNCNSNLICFTPTGAPVGSAGLCVPSAARGQPCGGAFSLAPQCVPGLTCRFVGGTGICSDPIKRGRKNL